MKALEKLAVPLLLLCASLLLYSSTYNAEFQFDDNAYILESSEVLDMVGCLHALADHFFRPDRMLVTLSFAANYAVHGFSPPGYHFLNILLHGLNGVLVFLLLENLLKISRQPGGSAADESSRYIALGCAFLFVVHPVAVNSVTYVTQRHGLLATFFYLSGFFSYLRIRSSRRLRRIGWMGCLCLCFWGAVHSKPMALTFPFAVGVCELVFRRRDTPFGRRTILWSSLLAALVAAILVGYALQSGLFSRNAVLAGFQSQHLWSPWAHMLTESLVFLHYWKILVLPLPAWLSADHYFPVIRSVNLEVLASWFCHILILGAGVRSLLAGMPLIAFGISWFYITLVPPYFLLPIQDVMVDYKTYLPSIGVFCIIAEGGRYGVKHFGVPAGICGLLLVGGFWCYGAVERNRIFNTQESFWTDVVSKYPLQARPYNNRGLAYHKKGEYEKAIAEFKKAIEISPDYGLVHANIGDSYRQIGDTLKALDHYRTYVRLHPGEGDGFVRLANIYAREGNWAAAVKYYEQAVKIEPKNLGAVYNLGLGFSQLGRYDQALHFLNRVVGAQPSNFKALAAIGAIHYKRGDKDIAREFFHKSLAIEPLFADALYNLAAYYAGEGRREEARKLAERLLQVDRPRGEHLLALLSSGR